MKVRVERASLVTQTQYEPPELLGWVYASEKVLRIESVNGITPSCAS